MPEVAIWWQETLAQPVPELQEELFLTMLNDAREMRRTAHHLEMDPDQLTAIAAPLPDELRRLSGAVAAG